MRDSGYFSQINDHFLQAIYASPKGAIRLAVLQRDLQAILTHPPLSILDVGGGAGQMAVWCATQGHQVTLIDMSKPLLNEAQKTAQQLSLPIELIQGNALALDEILGARQFDLVLCHAVLEWVAKGEKLLENCLNHVKPGGLLSLMYYNRTALEYTHHVYGNFDYIDAGLQAKKTAKLTPNYPRTRSWVQQQLARYPLHQQSGIRCFYDYMKPKDREANSLENIIKHELNLSERSEFLPVARYIHELRRKPLDHTTNNQ